MTLCLLYEKEDSINGQCQDEWKDREGERENIHLLNIDLYQQIFFINITRERPHTLRIH